MNYAQRHLDARSTPQSEPIPGSAQVPNSAGGFSWAVDDWTRLDRFLILGAEGGSYYASERKLTKENAEAVLRCTQADGARTVARVAEISHAGRAPKNDPAIFALALAEVFGDAKTKQAARAAIPVVCRIGTHLFQFVQSRLALGGKWSRGSRAAIAGWYAGEKSADDLAYQVVKYQQRDGMSHRDVLRMAHVPYVSRSINPVLRWAAKASLESRTIESRGRASRFYEAVGELPVIIQAFEQAKAAEGPAEIARLIREHNLPREAVPTQFLDQPSVWAALAERMPMTALIRNLATLTRHGIIAPLSNETKRIVGQLTDGDRLRKARVHPIQLLSALLTYKEGKGVRGGHTWEPVTAIIDALDDAFYASFGFLPTSDRSMILSLDVSGSMGSGVIAGVPGLVPCMGTAALALVFMKQFKNVEVMGFSHTFKRLNISPKMRLDEAMRHTRDANFGGTDCALPFKWARENKIKADGFAVMTDNETWAGTPHPSQALMTYRRTIHPTAKSVVVGMISNGFTVADPNDAGMLDVVGFDTNVPQLMYDFIAG